MRVMLVKGYGKPSPISSCLYACNCLSIMYTTYFLVGLGRIHIAERGRTGDPSVSSPRDEMVTCLVTLSSYSLNEGRKCIWMNSKPSFKHMTVRSVQMEIPIVKNLLKILEDIALH